MKLLFIFQILLILTLTNIDAKTTTDTLYKYNGEANFPFFGRFLRRGGGGSSSGGRRSRSYGKSTSEENTEEQ